MAFSAGAPALRGQRPRAPRGAVASGRERRSAGPGGVQPGAGLAEGGEEARAGFSGGPPRAPGALRQALPALDGVEEAKRGEKRPFWVPFGCLLASFWVEAQGSEGDEGPAFSRHAGPRGAAHQPGRQGLRVAAGVHGRAEKDMLREVFFNDFQCFS